MPPKSTQKQKQRQTVIVNIGDKLLAKKRKRRKPRKAAPSASLPPPPPSNDFARVIYQAQAMRPPDNLAVQLNAVTKQLEELQNKQLHKTGNLMAATAAIARAEGEQGSVLGEAPAPAPATVSTARGVALAFNPSFIDCLLTSALAASSAAVLVNPDLIPALVVSRNRFFIALVAPNLATAVAPKPR